MQLIIKPTSACNFACSFCSAGMLKIPTTKGVPEQIKNLLKVLKPEDIVITGGDPLMVPVSYFEELLSLGDWSISITTNLKDFYENPEKWISLFKNPRVGVCTSFQFGEGRKWDNDTPYSEEKFREVMEKYKQYIGKLPTFIAVICKDNEHRVLDHIYLAKELGTTCRINGVFKSGRSGEYYPLYKMLKHYINIIDLGLEQYEVNSLDRGVGNCPTNTNLYCSSSVRAAWVENNGTLKYGRCEDTLNDGYTIPYEKERPASKKELPQPKECLNKNCLNCRLCRLCNSCEKTRLQIKDCPEFCEEMKKLESDLIRLGWLL